MPGAQVSGIVYAGVACPSKTVFMFTKLFLWSCLAVVAMPLAAQTYTEKLTRQVPGQGTVRIVQEAAITRLVNGTPAANQQPRPATPNAGVQPAHTQGTDGNSAEAEARPVRKMKANGYRIQVYAGGNSRESRKEAQRMAGKVKSYFSDLSVYTHFQSPRWICRVGDFRTIEEANQVLHELRETNQFDEALIVKSVIQIAY